LFIVEIEAKKNNNNTFVDGAIIWTKQAIGKSNSNRGIIITNVTSFIFEMLLIPEYQISTSFCWQFEFAINF
jgi:hypothetical protein